MSFIAAFFAVNIHEFPSPLHLSYVSKYTFGIGLAISVPLIIGALTIDNLVRYFNRMIAPGTASGSSETDPLSSATVQILNARKWRPPWLWHARLLDKGTPTADRDSELSYKLPGRTPTVLSNTGNTNQNRHKMNTKDRTSSFATTTAVPTTTATPVATSKGTPESRSSPLFDQGIFSGRRRFSLVPRSRARASLGPGVAGGGVEGDVERGER